MTIPVHFHSADSINSLKRSFFGATSFDDKPTKCKGLESARKESINIDHAAVCQEYSLIQCSYFYEVDPVIPSF